MREEAHAALDRLLDAIERSAESDEARSAEIELLQVLRRARPAISGALLRMAVARQRLHNARRINDPPRLLKEKDAAYRDAADAFADIFEDAAQERAAIACAELSPLDPCATEIASGEVDVDALRGHRGRKEARNALARLVEDHARLLPPGFALQLSRSVHELNLGGKTDLFTPYKISGRSPDRPIKVTKDLAIYARIYYTAGYYNISIPEAIERVGSTAPAEIADRLSENTMHAYARRNRYKSVLNSSRKHGEEDVRRGRSFRPRVAGNYSLEQIWKLASDEAE